MHRALDGLKETIHDIKVDGNRFKKYYNIPHECIIDGDVTEAGISAASILAKVDHDKHIENLVLDNPDLEKYDLLHNMGYGTKNHRHAIHVHGHTQWHRKTFKFKGKITGIVNE
jgi:ribonuclease HII